MQELQFDYFRGGEAEQFSFYRIPKVLFTAECFRGLSCEAKVLYGLMLDRMGLSIKNRWFDEENRVYIVFTVDEVMELLNCKSQKAIKLIKELDCENGIGLIEKRRLGLGRPNVIYVKNFMIHEVNTVGEFQEEHHGDQIPLVNSSNEKHDEYIIIQNFENQKSGDLKIKSQDRKESKIQNFENQKSGMMIIKGPEFRKSNSNDTDISDTEKNDTIISNLSRIGICSDQMDMMETYRMIVKENVSYEALMHDGKQELQEVDELIELIVEVMMLPDDMTVRIGGTEKMAAVIKSRFMKLNMMHISYVLDCMRGNTTKINNVKAYILTALYNSVMTIGQYYQAEVNYDLYRLG